MDDLVVDVGHDRPRLGASHSRDATQVASAYGDKTACDLSPTGRDQRDRVARLEVSMNGGHADRQETAAGIRQRGSRTGIDLDRAAGRFA